MWYSVAKCLGWASQKSQPPGGDDEEIGSYCGRRRAAARGRFVAQAQEKISDGLVKIGMLEDMSSMPGRLSRAGAPLSEVIGPPLNYT
jgi:hypothetical protein